MDIMYQVQFRTNRNKVWTAYNMNGSKYDVTNNIDKAYKVLDEAKKWHTACNPLNDKFEYRIAKIVFRCEYITAGI